jgi:hypothetical protein
MKGKGRMATATAAPHKWIAKSGIDRSNAYYLGITQLGSRIRCQPVFDISIPESSTARRLMIDVETPIDTDLANLHEVARLQVADCASTKNWLRLQEELESLEAREAASDRAIAKATARRDEATTSAPGDLPQILGELEKATATKKAITQAIDLLRPEVPKARIAAEIEATQALNGYRIGFLTKVKEAEKQTLDELAELVGPLLSQLVKIRQLRDYSRLSSVEAFLDSVIEERPTAVNGLVAK